jgi:hypothetical protein
MDSTKQKDEQKKTSTTKEDPEPTYIIRQKGIEHLQRLLLYGCLIENIDLPTARKLCILFPTIQSSRIENKTIYYLKGKEKETLHFYLQKKPDKIMHYSKIKALANLLGITQTKQTKKEEYKKNNSDVHQTLLEDYL